MIQINKITESRIEHLNEVLALAKEAEQYVQSFRWCERIINGWLTKDWGYLLCVFYFEIEPANDSGADNFIWIVVGDLPSAYIDIQSALNEYEVLQSYVNIMKKWVEHVKKGLPVTNCFPVNVPPTIKYADMLSSRIKIIENDMLAELKPDKD